MPVMVNTSRFLVELCIIFKLWNGRKFVFKYTL